MGNLSNRNLPSTCIATIAIETSQRTGLPHIYKGVLEEVQEDDGNEVLGSNNTPSQVQLKLDC